MAIAIVVAVAVERWAAIADLGAAIANRRTAVANRGRRVADGRGGVNWFSINHRGWAIRWSDAGRRDGDARRADVNPDHRQWETQVNSKVLMCLGGHREHTKNQAA